MTTAIAIRPLTPDLWADFETVFGPQGACYGCWCTYFRLAAAERKLLGSAERKDFMHKRVDAGPPPGLLAYDGAAPFGWVQVGPRSELPGWNTPRTVARPLDPQDAEDPHVWAVSCFFMLSKYRGQGLSHAILQGAIKHAREAGARLLEACPMDHAKQAKSVGLYVGSTSVFRKAGFEEVALRKAGRPLMRLAL
ncbi:Acetyltransferase (GNAT) family protein [Hartmannibacter diazotrophicus]|uniref:Acetyltransferase (GNAT) family protein n=1 Tax=Hartmannibacter diazotrophicus TaxID=1482074 RepID=A0A2C9D8L3_9HYPH|nr:GNAT family N-acetyltransferase [Hartmannibacter diazotrophicus]SON55895.1 Acetyltransferase (GNAT) family protein [Hartmannibacter diazotrophicus]